MKYTLFAILGLTSLFSGKGHGQEYQSPVPIPDVPNLEAELEASVPSRDDQAPPEPPSPDSAVVEEALLLATGQASAELSSGRNSGGLFSKLFGKKKRSEPEPLDTPTEVPGYQYPKPSPYVGIDEASSPSAQPAATATQGPGKGSIFLNRHGKSSAAQSHSVRFEVGVDVDGVDVILPKGSRVTILDERDGMARVRIPDGRVGFMKRSAIE